MRLTLACLALPVLTTLFVAHAPETGDAPSRIETESASCGKCHKDIYAEWKQSQHAHAWTSDVYKAWLATKRKPEKCYNCHIPTSALATAPKKPKPRADRKDEGVGCAACHVLDGKVHGPHGKQCNGAATVKSDMHREGIKLCQACHRIAPTPVLPLGKDFEKAKLAAEGKSCKKCHMPEVEGYVSYDPKTGKPIGKKHERASHRFAGRTDPKMIAKAFEFHREAKGDKIVLRVENKTGHRIPGLQLWSYKLVFELLDAKGKVLASKDAAIDYKKNKLPVKESRGVEFDVVEGVAKGRVTIHAWFKRLKRDQPKDQGVVFTASK